MQFLVPLFSFTQVTFLQYYGLMDFTEGEGILPKRTHPTQLEMGHPVFSRSFIHSILHDRISYIYLLRMTLTLTML